MSCKILLRMRPRFARLYSSSALLTKDLYPDVKRSDFATITSRHLQAFERLLGKDRVITDKDDLLSYNRDWLNMVCGYSSVALKPKTTEEVSEILKICYKEHIAVCPQGGNTGLVGGSVPVFDEVVVSLSLMNKINKIDETAGIVSCEAGCVLERLDTEVATRGLMMPLDLGAKGSCQIGGNIATCAGGLRLIRYGSLAANVLGLRVVLANGEVLSMMNHMKKDNTGYHLKQLFVGSEGTLGIITEAIIQCPPRPKSVTLAFLGLKSYENVVKTFKLARSHLSETLSSCEMMDTRSMESVQRLGLSCPISENSFYMVIETHGSNVGHDEEKMSSFIMEAMDSGVVADGTYTSQPSTMHNLWQLRERITESLARFSYVYKYDISLPLNHFYEAVIATRKHLKEKGFKDLHVSGFGHVGDGNLHLNIEGKAFSREVLAAMEPWLFEWTTERGGSISAEHGLGFKKRKYMAMGKSPSVVGVMAALKAQLDPTGILNPYKKLWQLRERIAESVNRFGFMYSYDISLPLVHFYEAVEATQHRLRHHGFGSLKVSACGHIGDGNLHILIEGPSFQPEVEELLEPWLFKWTTERGGSISAEHGIGFEKRKYMAMGKSPSVVGAMAALKAQLDPTGILNPYKVI